MLQYQWTINDGRVLTTIINQATAIIDSVLEPECSVIEHNRYFIVHDTM